MSDQLAHAAERLRNDPALREVVRSIGESLQREILELGPVGERGILAWQEYQALQRIVAAIDQLAQDAVKEDVTNG